MHKFIFFGSSRFSILVLNELEKASLLPALIITTPDKPKGRGLTLTKPEVKVWAEERNIEFLQPLVYDQAFEKKLKEVGAEVFIVASFGKIIPQSTLDISKTGVLNVHPSLLPKYRGATPISSQILSDDRDVGVSIMVIDEKIDHGPVVSSKKIELKEWPVRASFLEKILGEEGGKLLSLVLKQWFENERNMMEQDHDKATFTKKIVKEDGELNLSNDPYKNYLKFCAYENSVGTYFFIRKQGKNVRVKIIGAQFVDNAFTPLRIIPEGGKEMDYRDFLRGL